MIIISRIFISALFLLAGLNKIMNFKSNLAFMHTANLIGGWSDSILSVILVGAILIEVFGGLSVLFNYRIKEGAYLLAGFSILAALLFHTDFSNQIQMVMFMKNFAIAGGLIYIAATKK